MEKTYNVNGIPNEMKELPGWLWWIGDKFPRTLRLDPATNECNHNNPFCLGSLKQVLYKIRHFTREHGLAFSFQREFGLTYIDLDDCRNPDTGELTEFASNIVDRLASYTEISVGKDGLHIVVYGQVEKPKIHTKVNWRGKQIEIKPFNFYMTVSGTHLAGTPQRVEERQPELTALYEEIFWEEPGPVIKRPEKNKPEVRGDNDVDRSACDFSICCDLARTGMSADEIEEVLRDHALMNRPKWTERPDYRRKTIQAALNSVR